MIISARALAMICLATATLAGCTSEREDRPGWAIVQSFVQREAAPVTLTSAQVDAVITESLRATQQPLALATFEKTQNNVILREIARNGSHLTWADAGTTERRTITTINGMLTSTRGLRQDLMSSDISKSLKLVSSRSNGTALRIQRYLDGENQIVELPADCTITRGETTRVRVGEIDRSAVTMTEACTAGTHSFTNIFTVDASGRILQSVQWLNDFYGVIVIQKLR